MDQRDLPPPGGEGGLTPSHHIVGELRQDYLGMQPMFFRTPPTFEEILSSLPDLEAEINSAGR